MSQRSLQPLVDTTAEPLLVRGDVVRVRDPAVFDKTFASKVRERDATVLWVGQQLGSATLSAKLRFHLRNGRGKEFVATLRAEDLLKVAPA
jgi:hypothetical protein